jgi:hypothetical protein
MTAGEARKAILSIWFGHAILIADRVRVELGFDTMQPHLCHVLYRGMSAYVDALPDDLVLWIAEKGEDEIRQMWGTKGGDYLDSLVKLRESEWRNER